MNDPRNSERPPLTWRDIEEESRIPTIVIISWIGGALILAGSTGLIIYTFTH